MGDRLRADKPSRSVTNLLTVHSDRHTLGGDHLIDRVYLFNSALLRHIKQYSDRY